MKYQFFLFLGLLASVQACDSSSSSKKDSPALQKPTTTTPTTDPATIPVTGGDALGGGEDAITLGTSRGNFLKSLGNTVSTHVLDFETASQKLSAAADVYCGSYSPEALAALKGEFKNAMLTWQELELYQMGPMTEKASSLKSRIYNWPNLPYLCKIDEEAMYAKEDGDTYVIPSEYNKIGLQALEYVIFEETLETGCPQGVTKTAWTALDRQSRLAARCAYMKPIAKDLVAAAGVLKNSWGSTDNNYLSQKVGDQATEQSALQEVFNNILYVDIEMKNKKLGEPAGQDIKVCPKSPLPCVEKQELRYSHLSADAFQSNVLALSDLLLGVNDAGGLLDVLRHENAVDSANKSEKNFKDLVTVVDSDKRDFDTLLQEKGSEDCAVSQNSWVCKVHLAIKTVVTDFKAEYASVLKVNVPVEKQGDND